ncbi:MAG: glycosyltransferase [Candidatus Cloacimonetes bacterium]|jgi:glycosyltransferase involved in cell wall biosynthesis|nr:glycosyltransferase [Candidatus Cloacimonadota bacterium]
MNILYISSKMRWVVVVSWMLRTAKGLENRGHYVWIISNPKSKFNTEMPKNIRLIPKVLGMDYNPISIIFLVRLIKKNKIDIVVTNIEKEISIGGIAAKICHIPNIRRVGREDDFFDRWKTRFNHQSFVTHNIVPCNDIAQQISEKFDWLHPRDFTTIYNGRNRQDFRNDEIVEQRKKIGLAENDKVIGITCRLSKVKYVQNLIEAFRKIAEVHPEWKLVITGEGSEKENLEKLAAESGFRNRIIFTGFSSDPILRAGAYDIGVLTSQKEGFPNTIVEYFASGIPVVATDVGGVREIIENDQNSFLVEFGNIEQLAAKFTLLMADEILRNNFAVRARQDLQEKFSETLMIDKLENLFLEQIKGKKC